MNLMVLEIVAVEANEMFPVASVVNAASGTISILQVGVQVAGTVIVFTSPAPR